MLLFIYNGFIIICDGLSMFLPFHNSIDRTYDPYRSWESEFNDKQTRFVLPSGSFKHTIKHCCANILYQTTNRFGSSEDPSNRISIPKDSSASRRFSARICPSTWLLPLRSGVTKPSMWGRRRKLSVRQSDPHARVDRIRPPHSPGIDRGRSKTTWRIFRRQL